MPEQLPGKIEVHGPISFCNPHMSKPEWNTPKMTRSPGFVAGAIWSVLNATSSVLVPLLIFVVFARILQPREVGLVALAVACCEMLKPFGGPGIYEALLQQPPERQDMHETASAILMLTGVFLVPVHCVVIMVLGSLVPGVADHRLVLSLVGLRIFLDLAAVQPQARLAQNLSFRRLALRSMVANTGAGVAGLAIALTGFPMLGLIVYQVGQSALGLLVTTVGTSAMARPKLHRTALRIMVREGWAASAVRLVSATNNYFDQIVIATLIGSQRLAFFNLAKRVETTFITAASSFSAILFQPLFAAGDTEARERALRRSLALITLTCGLPAAIVVDNASLVVTTIFGPQWASAATITAILALSGLARTFGGLHGALLSVSGRNRQLLAYASLSAVLGIVVVLPGSLVGLVWCAAGLAIKNAVFAGCEAYLTRKDVPGLARAYLVDAAIPFILQLGGGLVGRSLGDSLAPATWTGQILSLAFSTVFGLVTGCLYFGWRYRQDLRIFLATRTSARAGMTPVTP